MEFLKEPVFWTATALVLFILIMVFLKVPRMLAKALDGRAAVIRAEIDEARRLREEAQTLLANQQRKEREAEKEAEAILAEARAEAERTGAEARKELETFIARRRQQAEDKIARAEQQAVDDIRAYATEVSVNAAREIIRKEMSGARAGGIVDEAIAGLPERLAARR